MSLPIRHISNQDDQVLAREAQQLLTARVLSQSKMKIGQDELESKNWVTA